MLTLRLYFGQDIGPKDIPKKYQGGRILLANFLLCLMILQTGFKSKLRNDLLFPIPEKVPTTFYELSKTISTSPLNILLWSTGSIEIELFNGSHSPVLQAINEKLTVVLDLQECLMGAFINPLTVCIGWDDMWSEVAKTMLLNPAMPPFSYSKDVALLGLVTIGFQENSIFLDSFSPMLSSVAEMGILKKWQEWSNRDFQKSGREKLLANKESSVYKKLVELSIQFGEQDVKPLSIRNLVGAFYTSFIGIGISLLFFIFEILKSRHFLEKV